MRKKEIGCRNRAASGKLKMFMATGAIHTNPEHLDQGKKTKLVLTWEWFGSHIFLPLGQGVGWNDKGVMEIRNGGNVP